MAKAATQAGPSQRQSAVHTRQAADTPDTFSHSHRKTGKEVFRITSDWQSSQQAAQDRPQRPPIRQNGTPKISVPPGVSAPGKREYGAGKEPDSSYRRDIPPAADTARTQHIFSAGRSSGSTQPPVGTAETRQAPGPGRPPVGGTQSPVGMAETQRASGPSRPPIGVTQPPAGTAETQRTSGSSRPPVGGTHSLVDMAGAQQVSGSSRPPVGGTQPSAGTAGMQRASGPSRPPVGGTQSPVGTAGMQRAPGPSRPPVDRVQPSTGTAGTQQASGPSWPPIGGTQSPIRAKVSHRTTGASRPPTAPAASGETAAKDSSAGTHRIKRPAAPPNGITSKKRNKKNN